MTAKIEKTITVDGEFAALMPAQSQFELATLEASLKEEGGARDPITVWKTQDGNLVLVDGHTRKRICDRLGLKYSIREVEFKDRKQALLWVFQNQLSRRNLSKEKASEVRATYVQLLKGPARAKAIAAIDGEKAKPAVQQAAEDLAVSPATLKRDVQFKKGISTLKKAEPALAEEVLSGKSKVNQTTVQALGAGKVKVEDVKAEAERAHKHAEGAAVPTNSPERKARAQAKASPASGNKPVQQAGQTVVSATVKDETKVKVGVLADAKSYLAKEGLTAVKVDRQEKVEVLIEKLSLFFSAKTIPARAKLIGEVAAKLGEIEGKTFEVPAEYSTETPAKAPAKAKVKAPTKAITQSMAG